MNPFVTDQERAEERRREVESRRHRQLMAVANRLIDREASSGYLSPKYEANAKDLVALAFGRHQLTVDEAEADRYLNAARAEKGVTR